MTIERELLKRFMTELKTEEDVVSLFNDIKECLAEPEQTEQEPVAWIIETEIHGKLSEWICTDKKHYMEEHDSIKEPIPLYTAPQKREPLSDGEITDLWANKSPANEFECVRLVEKAHGIGGEE
jgi:hypothetical protein